MFLPLRTLHPDEQNQSFWENQNNSSEPGQRQVQGLD